MRVKVEKLFVYANKKRGEKERRYLIDVVGVYDDGMGGRLWM
jgi:hypothetical protein